MKTKTDKQYDKIFNELKEDKMNWDFNDFLTKTEETPPIIPLKQKPSNGKISKFYWLAASLVLLISVGAFFTFNSNNNIENQDQLVKNEILRPKNDFRKSNDLAALQTKDTVKVVSDSLVTDSASVNNNEDVLEKILPKRGRIKRQTRPHFVQNKQPKKSAPNKIETSDYQSNYVIINGQKIESEKEAIDLTKYSFRILSENVSKTVASTEVKNSFNNDY